MGIFWYCPVSRQLLTVLVKAESNQVERNGNWVDFAPGHVDIWHQVEAKVDWSLYPEYDGEYFYLPRGRILWHVERHQHRIILDSDIDLDVLFEALSDHGVDRANCEILTDEHYRSTQLRSAEIYADLDG